MGCSSSKAVLPQAAGDGSHRTNHKPSALDVETHHVVVPQVYVPPTFQQGPTTTTTTATTTTSMPSTHGPSPTVVVKQPVVTTTTSHSSATTTMSDEPGSHVNPLTAAVYAQAKCIGEAALAADDPGHKEVAKGDELRGKKEFRLAFKQYEFALTVRKNKLGTERHGLIADAYAKMGVCRIGEGYADLGYKLHMQALQMRRELFGESSGPVGESYGHLGDTLVAMQNHRDARCQYEKAIEIRTKTGDATSPKTASYCASLGNCHRVMQDFDRALVCLQKARQSFEVFLGPDHDDTINCWFVIALIHQEQGHYQQAMPYHEAALQARERVHGPTSVLASASYMNIGLMQKSMGQFDQAQTNIMKSLQIRTVKLGQQHEETAVCVANLGSVMMAKKAYRQAMAFYQNAQQSLEQGVGANHPMTWNVYCKIAECHRAQRQYESALAFYDQALTVALLVFGTKSKQASSVRIWMAQTKLENMDIVGALEGFRLAYKLDLAIRPQDPTTIKMGQLVQSMEKNFVK